MLKLEVLGKNKLLKTLNRTNYTNKDKINLLKCKQLFH